MSWPPSWLLRFDWPHHELALRNRGWNWKTLRSLLDPLRYWNSREKKNQWQVYILGNLQWGTQFIGKRQNWSASSLDPRFLLKRLHARLSMKWDILLAVCVVLIRYCPETKASFCYYSYGHLDQNISLLKTTIWWEKNLEYIYYYLISNEDGG